MKMKKIALICLSFVTVAFGSDRENLDPWEEAFFAKILK